MGKQPREIKFHYIKSIGYRLVPADGAYGGITTRGKICVNFFAERSPIPKSIEYKIDPKGTINWDSPKFSADSKQGIIREIENGVIMDLNTAIELRDWLTDKIEALKQSIPSDKSSKRKEKK